jgi:3-deoxy-D-manno-octulosonate 8-phosphate phosphatase (KDO 8-P phosphatase)
MDADLESRARGIRVAIFDVDGVMTDGTLFLDDHGNETKGFSVLDGLGLKMLADSGVRVAILTGRRSRCVELRAANLGIELVWQGVEDKRTGFADILAATGLGPEAASYMGDDIVDIPVLRRCGLAFSVPGGHALAREHAHHVTTAGGGKGAVREVCELIMQAQGTLEARLRAYLA